MDNCFQEKNEDKYEFLDLYCHNGEWKKRSTADSTSNNPESGNVNNQNAPNHESQIVQHDVKRINNHPLSLIKMVC